MVKIALIGYGRLGKMINEVAKQREGFEIVAKIDPYNKDCLKEINEENLKNVDVCIDFSHPTSVMQNIANMAKLGKNMVIGTTGWYDKMEEVKDIVEKKDVGLIWSGNFSIGVNAFFRIIEYATKIFNNLPEYDALGHEYHHKFKADSPSGTAKMIADRVVSNMDRKNKATYDKLDRKIEDDEFHLSSTRGGNIPGTHMVLFDSPQDTIELKHTARTREGFASGSLLAAKFIEDKKGMFKIDDMMKDIIK